MSNLVPVSDIKEMAKAMGPLFKKKPEDMFALMLIAQAEGKHPAIAAQEYDIIDGRPAINSRSTQARFQLSGGKIKWIERTDKKVSCELSHPDGGSLTITWDMDRAKQAGLTGKSNWLKYPMQMLSARCVAEGVRALYPACLSGMYTVEEVQDFDEKPEPKVAENQRTQEKKEPTPEPKDDSIQDIQDTKDIQDVDSLIKEVFELLKTKAKFINDPDGYTEFEREVIQTTELFTRGKKDKDVAALTLLRDRVNYYELYRGTVLQEKALTLIDKYKDSIPPEIEMPEEVTEIDPELMEIV
jgi:hypothetical protein